MIRSENFKRNFRRVTGSSARVAYDYDFFSRVSRLLSTPPGGAGCPDGKKEKAEIKVRKISFLCGKIYEVAVL